MSFRTNYDSVHDIISDFIVDYAGNDGGLIDATISESNREEIEGHVFTDQTLSAYLTHLLNHLIIDSWDGDEIIDQLVTDIRADSVHVAEDTFEADLHTPPQGDAEYGQMQAIMRQDGVQPDQFTDDEWGTGTLAQPIFDVDDDDAQEQEQIQQFDEQSLEALEQTAQEYEQNRLQTTSESTSAWMNACKIYPPGEAVPDYLAHLVEKTEFFCRYQLLKKQDPLLSQWFHARERGGEQGVVTVDMVWTKPDGTVNSPKYFFNLISRIPYTEDPLNFRASADSAIDYGGVTRAVFTKASLYIKEVMNRDGFNRLYFPTRTPRGFGAKLAHVIKMSLLQGVVLGIPLSYGLLHFIQAGPKTVKEMSLPTLMYLCGQDNHTELMQALNYIGDDSLEVLVDMEPKGHFGHLGGQDVEVTKDDRYEWLKRHLYHLLYRTGKNTALKEFYESDVWKPDSRLRFALKAGSLIEMAEVLGESLTLEGMLEIIERAEYEPGVVHLKDYLKRYARAVTVGDLAKLLIFGTGSSDQSVDLKFKVGSAGKLPVAHTCFNTIDLDQYTDYGKFKQHMDMALSASDDFSSA
jgi:hypothetical protein